MKFALSPRAIAAMASIVLLGACGSDSSSAIAPLVPSASDGLQLFRGVSGATSAVSNQWTQRADLPFPRAYTVTGVANGKLYTFGGANTTQIFNTTTEYNPSTNSWTTKAPMPKTLNSQLGATTIGSLIYLPGGWNSVAYQKHLLIYDPVADSWTTGNPMPIAGACGGSVLIGGMMYVAIGCDDGGAAGKLLRYDPSNSSWLPLPSAPGNHSAGSVIEANGKLFWDNGTAGTGVDVYDPATNAWTFGPQHLESRVSGVSATLNGVPVSAGGYVLGALLTSVEYMDEEGNKWLPRSNMILGIGAASSAVLNGEWYVVGGNGQGSLNTVATVQKYTPGDYWLTATTMPTPRGYLSAAAIGSEVYAIGGRLPSSTTPLPSNEQYSTATESWTTLAPLPSARWGAAAAVAGGRVYVIGGFTGDSSNTATNTVYEYTPGSNTWQARANAPTPIGYASAAVVQGNIYVSAGTDGTTFDGRKAYRYDPVADTWSVLANSPGAHSHGIAVGIATYFITIGGSASGGAGRKLDAYKVNTSSWVSGPPAPSALVGASGGAIGTKVYMAFGRNNGTYTSAISVFDGIALNWSTRTAAPQALAYAASAVANAQLITVGGFLPNGTATGAARRFVP